MTVPLIKMSVKDSNYDFLSFSGNNDAKPNNVESAGEGLVAGTSGMSSDPYEASVSAALSSMNINSEAAAQGNLLRGIVELVSKELNHFGVIAGLFRQIGGHV